MSNTNNEQRPSKELFPGRVTLSVPEFCQALGWHRSRFWRHKDSIRQVHGLGRTMIPVTELDRLLGIEPAPETLAESEA